MGILFSPETKGDDYATFRRAGFHSQSTAPMEQGPDHWTKPPLKPIHVWTIRTRLQLANRTRDLALSNLAIDSKLRGCDVVSLKVEDIVPQGYAIDRATVRQRKAGHPVKFEINEQTRQSVDAYLLSGRKRPGDYIFNGQRGEGHCLTARQYARLLSEWIGGIELDASQYGTHSIRRTKATLIYRRTSNLRAAQLLLGHTISGKYCRYLRVEVEDALEIAEQIDI